MLHYKFILCDTTVPAETLKTTLENFNPGGEIVYSAYLEAVKIRVTLAYNNSFQSKPLKPKMLAMKLNYENVPTTCLRNQTDKNISSGPSFVGYNAHQVNAARVALPNQTSDVINAVMDDEKADHTDSDSFRAEYRYQRGYTKPLERLKSRVWVHLALFSMTVGIIVVTTALCFLNFGNPEFSEVEMIPTSNIQIANFMPTPAQNVIKFKGLPSIKYFLIEDSSLNFERYKVLEQFLKNHTVLFHVVTFQRCFICKQCKVLDVAFPNSEVEIFNRKKDPFE
ncbi:unnamed protein product [Allacma fusca]|uniref:Uncharacterized protein n=1 Tax=Allacma fusca TaxID=39272 RepID=A0A8J2JM12_9HEXA|nr:unnamed protein product [Allacma fusca]